MAARAKNRRNNFGNEPYEEHFDIGPLAPEEKSFKGFSIFSSGHHFCSAKRNHFSNFGGGLLEEHFCANILKLSHWPRMRYHLKFFLFLALAALLFNGAEPLQPSWISD